MNRIRSFVTRYQMAVFLFLAYLISWAFIFPAEGGLLPQGPMIAAFIVLGVISGRQGVSGLWRQMVRWRVGWIWYLVAPGIFIAIHLIALAASLALGSQVTNTAHLQSLPAYLGIVIPLVFFGGQWEEPGWTGYVLPHFQRRLTLHPLVAVFATGLVRMVWHTPLLMSGAIPWYDYLFYSFALQVILTWLYNRTQGSVLIAMIGHLFSNLMPATLFPLFGGAHQEQYWMLMVLASWVVVLGLLITTRGRLGFIGEREPAIFGLEQGTSGAR
jgi:hypothetical protein